MINKVLAATLSICFLTFVRPDAEPERWSVALLAVLMYEGIRWSLDYIKRMKEQELEERYDAWLHQDGRRWANERIAGR
jgi:hypothetical protein